MVSYSGNSGIPFSYRLYIIPLCVYELNYMDTMSRTKDLYRFHNTYATTLIYLSNMVESLLTRSHWGRQPIHTYICSAQCSSWTIKERAGEAVANPVPPGEKCAGHRGRACAG